MTNHTTAEIRRWHTELRQGNEDWYDLAGELLDKLEAAERWNTEKTALNNSLKSALEATEVLRLRGEMGDLNYRHECLKSMYTDEMNYLDDDLSVDLAIDEFILEEQSHS